MVINADELLAWLGWATTAIVSGAAIYNRYQSRKMQKMKGETKEMANGNNPRSHGTGKGASLKTDRNPFLTKTSSSRAPGLSGIVSLGGVLDKVLERECAILLGNTRDGGALCITILDGQDRHRTYCSTEDETREAFEAIAIAFE